MHYAYMHACTYSINIVCKRHGKTVCILPFLQFVLSHNNEIVFAIITYMHDT